MPQSTIAPGKKQSPESYRASPIKRRPRRTKAEIERIREAMVETLRAEKPMTVRQVFYRLVSKGVIAKKESEYKDTVGRLLTEMRRSREIPFGWIADATRWQRKPKTHSSLASMLRRTADTYRQAIWDLQDVYVEIWLEKDALAGVLYQATAKWDVPLMVTRGYPSLSYLHSAAEALEAENKPCHLYYFGDHDPSGVDIPVRVEADLKTFAPGAEIHFERVAVLPAQIDEWDLQTRPTKKSDSRSKNFKGESVEVDAIPPDQLRELVEECITKHIDKRTLRRTRSIEKAERETLGRIIKTLDGAA